MEDSQPTQRQAYSNNSAPAVRKTGSPIKYVLVGLLVLLAAAGSGAAAYIMQQSQIDKLIAANNDLTSKNSQSTAAKGSQLATFAEEQIPYTFMYPAGWTKQYDMPIHTNPNLVQSKYTITLMAPGTRVVTEPIGSASVRDGAEITVSMSQTQYKTPEDWLKADFAGKYVGSKFQQLTVGGQNAIQYTFGYESQEQLITVLVKDGKVYRYSFVGGDGLLNSKEIQTYKDLLASVKFKS